MSWVRSPLAAPVCFPLASPPHAPATRLRRHLRLGLCELEARLLSGEDACSPHAGILRVATELCGGELHLPAAAYGKAIDDMAGRGDGGISFLLQGAPGDYPSEAAARLRRRLGGIQGSARAGRTCIQGGCGVVPVAAEFSG